VREPGTPPVDHTANPPLLPGVGTLVGLGTNRTAIGAVQTMLAPRHMDRRCRPAATIARSHHPGCDNAWRHGRRPASGAGCLFPVGPRFPHPVPGTSQHPCSPIIPCF